MKNLLKKLRPATLHRYDHTDSDRELLRYAFTDTLEMSRFLLHEPVTSIDQLNRQVLDMLVPIELLWDAYNKISNIKRSDSGGSSRFDYDLVGLGTRSAHTYRLDGPHETAALLIPGSGPNQSTRIVLEDEADNYHQQLGSNFQRRATTFVYIKPNEDYLAIHNGFKKLHQDFYLNFLLHRGGSYSATYLIDTLAIIKFLKQEFSQTVVAGVSQGGTAALYNALQSEPTVACIGSGYSLLNKTVLWSSHNQLLIPGLDIRYPHEMIRDQIDRSSTRYLFTFGKKDNGTFRIEAEERLLASDFSTHSSCSLVTHPGGHELPWDAVEQLFSELCLQSTVTVRD